MRPSLLSNQKKIFEFIIELLKHLKDCFKIYIFFKFLLKKCIQYVCICPLPQISHILFTFLTPTLMFLLFQKRKPEKVVGHHKMYSVFWGRGGIMHFLFYFVFSLVYFFRLSVLSFVCLEFWGSC